MKRLRRKVWFKSIIITTQLYNRCKSRHNDHTYSSVRYEMIFDILGKQKKIVKVIG